jgi:carboxyl-terminal processing protease
MKRGASFRVAAGTLILGLVVGAGGTLLGLKVANVSLTPGTASPAFQKFFSAYHLLHDNYYLKESNTTLLNGAVAGMTNSIGDPFTDYFAPVDAKQFNQMLSGSFVGIGVTIEQNQNGIEIQSVMTDSPAKKAGLLPHDVIVQVNGKSVTGMSLQQVSSLVVGPVGTSVTIGVHRRSDPGQVINLTMKRAKITKPSVMTKMLSGGIGYMQISVVAENTAGEVSQGLADLKNQGAKVLILDLRGNPGGYLNVAVDIASDFIPKGKVIVQTEDRSLHIDKLTSKGPGDKLPVVVLMDQDTASAAEILSAALHDDDGVPLVGTRSFGKGTVQETQAYPDGSTLKYTVAKWLTPTGDWINKKGLTPTDLVNLPAYVSLPSISSQKLPLQENQNAKTVQYLQQTLQALKYPVDRTDGFFDASTKQAVMAVQKQAGLPQTGVVDTKTAAAIDKQFQALLVNSDTQLQKAQAVAKSLEASH